MRSPASAGLEMWKTVPRSTRRTKSRLQSRAMSVALDDQGEIVPSRGATSTSADQFPGAGAGGP